MNCINSASRKKISVLMSTYNGGKYLQEQIESILNQKLIEYEIELFVRDDGSTDNTLEILKEYENKSLLRLEIGDQNLGPALSFWKLLLSCKKSEFYAFADQDDVWMPNKLQCALDQIRSLDSPALYLSNAQYIDGKGNLMHEELFSETPSVSIATIFAGIPALGCTMVFNGSLYNELVKADIKHIEMHDKYCMLCALLNGRIVYDNNSYILYRQHGNNVVSGRSHDDRKKIFREIKRVYKFYFKRGRCSCDKQAADFLEAYKDSISSSDAQMLNLFKKYKRSFSAKKELLHLQSIKGMTESSIRSYKIRLILNLF